MLLYREGFPSSLVTIYKQNNVQAAIEKLSILEKHTRQVRFGTSTPWIILLRLFYLGFRSGVYFKITSCHRYNIERVWRLELAG